MRILFFSALLLFSVVRISGQTGQNIISVAVENKPLQNLLEEIEKKTGYTFYFAPQWLDTTAISKSYIDVSLSDILEDVFSETEINFFIGWDNRIVLTQNNSIYCTLPQGILETPKEVMKTVVQKGSGIGPVLSRKRSGIGTKTLKTVRIGKEGSEKLENILKLSGYVKNTKTGGPI
jgi:hypothetical protein